MNEIARWTTPTFTFKPSAVEIENVDEIFLVVKQNGAEKLRKSKADAVVDTNGFAWAFSQEETSALCGCPATIQIDYTSGTARYTTYPRQYNITQSAINEVI